MAQAQDSALRGENTIRLAKCTEDDELSANRELARAHGAVGDRVMLVNAVSARLRAMLSEARIGASGTITHTALKDKEKGREKALARLPNGFANNPPAWLDERAPGWALRGWPDGLPLNKPISAWSSPQLYSVLAMLLQARIVLAHPSLTPDGPIRAPQDVEPPRARPRRSGSAAPSVAPESDNDESEVLGLLEPTLADVRGASPGALSVPTDAGSATIPPNSPRAPDDDAEMDRTTLAASASPQNSKGKGKARAKQPVRARMKAKVAPQPRAAPVIRVGDGAESEAADSDSDGGRASPSEESEESDDEQSDEEEEEEQEQEETPEPPSPAASKSKPPSPAKSTASKRERPADDAAEGPPAKKHRRSRSASTSVLASLLRTFTMSSFMNKMKSKLSERRRSKEAPPKDNKEPTYSIQPHPATTNDPADLTRGPTAPGMPESGGGLNQGMHQYPQVAPYAAKGPYIPSPEISKNLDKPATREELHARTAELNRGL